MKEKRIIRLFRQRESLKRELERTEKALRPLNVRACRLRQKIEFTSNVDEVWDGMPVKINVSRKHHGGYISLVDENHGGTNTIRWVRIDYRSTGRGRLRTYEITIYATTGHVTRFNQYYPLGRKKISEVQAIVREWITKGTINGKDPRVK